MERLLRIAHTWLLCLTFVVAALAGAMAHGGSRWVDMASRKARFTGWGSPAPASMFAAEALLPEPIEPRLVLYLPMPDPVLRQGASERRTAVPAQWTSLPRAGAMTDAWGRQSDEDRPDRIREWQPPPRAPDWT